MRNPDHIAKFLAAVVLFAGGTLWAQALPSEARLQNEIHKYEQLTRDNPRDVELWHILGALYREAEQWDKAIAAETQAIQGHPKYAVAFYGRGKAKMGKAGTPSNPRPAEDYSSAVEDFTSSIRLFEVRYGPIGNQVGLPNDKDYIDCYRTRGVAQAHLNKYPEAIADISIAIKLRKDDPKLLYERGYLEEKAGMKKDAIPDYHRAGMLYADLFPPARESAEECIARLDNLGATAEANAVRLKLIPKTPKSDLPR